jgi:hypothetical protein
LFYCSDLPGSSKTTSELITEKISSVVNTSTSNPGGKMIDHPSNELKITSIDALNTYLHIYLQNPNVKYKVGIEDGVIVPSNQKIFIDQNKLATVQKSLLDSLLVALKMNPMNYHIAEELYLVTTMITEIETTSNDVQVTDSGLF